MKMNKNTWMPVTGFILIGAAIGMIFASNMNWPSRSIASKPEGPAPAVLIPASQPSDAVLQLQNTSQAFVEITKETLPAVVTITATKYVTLHRSNNPFAPFFEEWFDRHGRDQEDQSDEERIPQGGLGSGFIVSEDGYILTNNHVVGEADELTVELSDNRKFEAEIVGTDPYTDVAVIKIDGSGLPVARLGESASIQIGEWVLAMGNPLGLNSTVTAGIVSALNRNIGILQKEMDGQDGGGAYDIENFIQTDAAINRGNSGGPLVNLKGEVIGVNTAIASGTGFYAGYGFAIPIDLARKVMNDLITQGYVTRAYLGIAMVPVSENEAEYYGLEQVRGARIEQVVEDSPADKAGLKKLDIILKVDDKEITEPGDVQSYVAMQNPGDEIRITVLRDRKEKVIRAELGKRDTGREEAKTADSSDKDSLPDLGIKVQNLTGEIRSQLDYYDNDEGVIVTGVDRYGPGAEARILRGDLITKIEDIEIDNVSDYRKALRSFEKGDVVIFHLKRRAEDTVAFVKIPE